MLNLIAAISLLSASLSLAKPVEKREVGGILICEEANASGQCLYQVYKMDTCYNLTSPFHGNAATFAPDGEAFYCYPYVQDCGGICTSPTGCTFGAVTYDYKNKFNLTAIGWDKYISSFECHLNETGVPTTPK